MTRDLLTITDLETSILKRLDGEIPKGYTKTYLDHGLIPSLKSLTGAVIDGVTIEVDTDGSKLTDYFEYPSSNCTTTGPDFIFIRQKVYNVSGTDAPITIELIFTNGTFEEFFNKYLKDKIIEATRMLSDGIYKLVPAPMGGITFAHVDSNEINEPVLSNDLNAKLE